VWKGHNPTGQRLDDSTDLLYYGARYYDPALRRWVQADTLVPEPGDPQSLNRYSYVLNNPLRYTDPTGHCIPGVDCPGMPSGVDFPSDPSGLRWEEYAAWLVNYILWQKQQFAETGGMLDIALSQASAGTELATFLLDDPELLGDLLYQEVAGAAPHLASMAAGVSADTITHIGGWVADRVTQAARKVPNPYGAKGGPAHQAVVGAIRQDIKSRGLKPREEFRVELHGPGTEGKGARRVDIAALDVNGNPVEFHQVGGLTRSGRPIARDRRAIIDIWEFGEYAGVPIYFHPK